jgi:hypothetical protein
MATDPPQGPPNRPFQRVPPPGTPPPTHAPEQPRTLLVPPPTHAPEPPPAEPTPASFEQPRTLLGLPNAAPPTAPTTAPPAASLGAVAPQGQRTIVAQPPTPLGAVPPPLDHPRTMIGHPTAQPPTMPRLGAVGVTPGGTQIAMLAPELVAAAADLDRAAHTASEPGVPTLPAEVTEQDVAALKRFAKIRGFFAKHGHLLWWLHSAYAMSFGAMVVIYAGKGYENARWMVVLLGAGWVVLILFFRLFGTGRGQKDKIKDTKAKVRFYVMTLALKNLYQSMLFFLLPFYYKSATFDSPNRFFVYVLGLLAILSTVDVVFDQFLMRWKAPASLVYFFILFACLNLVLPALLPNTRTLITLMSAAAVAALVFFTMHVPLKNLLRPLYVIGLMAFVAASVAAAYFGRRGIPPVPMYIASGAVGPSLLPDGRLTMHVSKLHESLIQEMHALTDVLIPGGQGDHLFHNWRHNGLIVQPTPVEPSGDPPQGTVRLRSTIRSFSLHGDITGPWSIDVVTEDDQLVGRVNFEVIN